MRAVSDWLEDAFFDEPLTESVDGGTTSHGLLWHGVTPRWGHSMHPMCSYHGMFPAKLAHYFIQRYSKEDDLVLDPFSGRGTTALQARVEGRRSISNDLNPLAYVLSRAKTSPPTWLQVNRFVDRLEQNYRSTAPDEPDVSPDIRMLFHRNTLRQLVYLRTRLFSRPMNRWSRQEFMTAGCIAGILHGSHRSDGTSAYLSISMPNTFSMAPSYVKKYIQDKRLTYLDQDVFSCLRDKLARLYLDAVDGPTGKVFRIDAPSLLNRRSLAPASVDLLLTSPPYLRVVNYGTANWIRLWWLGLDNVGRNSGDGRRRLDAALDHQHKYDAYRAFILRTFRGAARVLRPDGVAVFVIGDVATPTASRLPLAEQVWADVGRDSGLRFLDLIEDSLPQQNKVSRIWGETKGQATDRDCILVLGRADGKAREPSQVITWDEPYKDGGPDAAHARTKCMW